MSSLFPLYFRFKKVRSVVSIIHKPSYFCRVKLEYHRLFIEASSIIYKPLINLFVY